VNTVRKSIYWEEPPASGTLEYDDEIQLSGVAATVGVRVSF
jgi:hypothetical protein